MATRAGALGDDAAILLSIARFRMRRWIFCLRRRWCLDLSPLIPDMISSNREYSFSKGRTAGTARRRSVSFPNYRISGMDAPFGVVLSIAKAQIQSARLVFVVKSSVYYTLTWAETLDHPRPAIPKRPGPAPENGLKSGCRGGAAPCPAPRSPMNLLAESNAFCYRVTRV